jgi:hypothetical protein
MQMLSKNSTRAPHSYDSNIARLVGHSYALLCDKGNCARITCEKLISNKSWLLMDELWLEYGPRYVRGRTLAQSIDLRNGWTSSIFHIIL